MSFYVFFFIFGLVSCYSQSSTNICSIHQNNDHIQDFSDCTKYILCSNGEPTSYSCEDGTKFDPILRLCSYQPVKCFQCPSDTFFIDLPVDYACSQFVRCINGQARHYACDSGLLFDPIRRQCNSKNSVVCPCPAVDFEGFPLFVRDWSDCSRYKVCANGTVVLSETCAPGLYFNLIKKQCVAESQDCRSVSTNSVFEEMRNL